MFWNARLLFIAGSSWGGTEYQNGSILEETGALCHIELIQLRHEKRRPSTRGGVDGGEIVSAAGVAGEHVDGTCSAAYIDPVAPRIEEHVVRIGAGWIASCHGTCLAIQEHQLRRRAEHRRDRPTSNVDRHWEVFRLTGYGPFRHLAPRRKVDHGDLSGIRDIDVGAVRARIDLKRFRMTW